MIQVRASGTVEQLPGAGGSRRCLEGVIHGFNSLYERGLMRRCRVCVLLVCSVAGVFSLDRGVSSAADWARQSLPVPTLPIGSLSAVSCRSATICVAVGGSLAERWRSGRWAVARMPLPARATAINLSGVSCESRSRCVAVGRYRTATGMTDAHMLAERWNGVRWTVLRPRVPRNATTSSLLGVSCIPAGVCVAVGSFTGDHRAQVIVERLRRSRWSLERVQLPIGGAPVSLNAVSCTSASSCTAVGTGASGGHLPGTRRRPGQPFDASGGLVERWDGTRWSLQPTPIRATDASLASVSCTSATACTAVGSEYRPPSYGSSTLVERWNGSHWSRERSGVIGCTGRCSIVFDDVSCSSASACAAVGTLSDYGSDSIEGHMLAARWNGSRWRATYPATQTEPPCAANQCDAVLQGVSCPTRSVCIAVGHRTAVNSVTIAEQWNRSAWSPQNTLNNTTAAPSALTGVSCASSSACTAVGGSVDATGFDGSLVDRWDGIAWSTQNTPGGMGPLLAVSCPSTTSCVAIGESPYASGTFSETWDGGAWTVHNTASPPLGTLDALSCSSPTACTAVGSFNTNETLPLVERWNGNDWTLQTAPVPLGQEAGLDGVACTSATACTAVGGSVAPPGGPGLDHTLVEVWDGTKWTIQSAPDAGGASLDAIACSSPTACEALSQAPSTGGTSLTTTTLSWDGTAWTAHAVATPAGSAGVELTSLSCASATSCTAVGDLVLKARTTVITQTVAEVWDGTEWALQTTANPTDGELKSVSCPSPTDCLAVGTSGSSPLAERS